jgi:hypothetical protein
MTSGPHSLKRVWLWLVLPILQTDLPLELSQQTPREHSKLRLRILPLF